MTSKRMARTFDNIRLATVTKPDPEAAYTKGVFQRVFGTPDGQYVMAVLRLMTKDRVVGADVSDSALRMLEGQRQLVAKIEGLIASVGRTDSE